MTNTKKRFIESRYLLLLFLPVLIYLIMFRYAPMWGVLISFQNFRITSGFFESEWVGLQHFQTFFSSPFAFRVIRNTFLLGFYGLLWGFPIPIIFALILNEVRSVRARKFVQTVSYLPFFISVVVMAGMLREFLSPNGIVNQLIMQAGGEAIPFFNMSGWFRTIFIASDIWQTMGWNAIIFIAALASVNTELYEAAEIDGCNKLQKILYVDIPCIMPTIIIVFLLRIGQILSVSFERVLVLYNPAIYETADVIGTFMFRQAFVGAPNFSYAAAVGLFQSVVGMIFLIGSNAIAKRVSDIRLW